MAAVLAMSKERVMPRSHSNGDDGFTLIELMIVVAVVAILAVIAYPSYMEHMVKTRRAEGRAAMMEVASRLERCYTRFNAYDNAVCSAVASMTSENGFYRISASAINATAFTLQAEPQLAQTSDTKCGTLTLTSVGVRGQSGTPPAGYKCW
jgi:type IV pilus assembly protein PilE